MKDIVERLREEARDWKGGTVVTEAATEIERLRVLFKKVQDHCAGDALPRWDKGPRTCNSRGYLLDICNSALD